MRVLPLTTTIAIVVGASPSETFWRNEVAKSTARLADRVQFRWYNELSFEDMLKDGANLPPHSAIFWIGLNVDAAGVAHEGNSAFSRLYRVANAPIFFTMKLSSVKASSAVQCRSLPGKPRRP